ncbi:uncharacterized protein [Centruroides vittatus]|uniref:uncharacterized protein n=1 Tax=Centruroides vittatus TaxID=120091 RepID=UPI00350FE547
MKLEDFQRLYKKASSMSFSLNKIGTANFRTFLKQQAQNLESTEECIFFLLLSCCAGCMGEGSVLELTPDWQESPIFWSVLVTGLVQDSLGITDRLCQQLIEVQNECGRSGENSEGHNQFVVEFFDTEGLIDVLHSRGSALALYYKLDLFKEILSTSKGILDVLEKLYQGSSLIMNYGKLRRVLQKPCMNISCISEPFGLYQILCKRDSFSKFVENCFSLIGRSKIKQNNNSLPIQSSHSLKKLFKTIYEIHKETKLTYKLTEEAQTVFSQYHDEFVELMTKFIDKSKYPIYQNATKLLARVSLILHVIENALNTISWNLTLDHLIWNVEIDASTLHQARIIVNFLLQQKDVLVQSTIFQRESNFVKTFSAIRQVSNVPNHQPIQNRTPVKSSTPNHVPTPQNASLNAGNVIPKTATNSSGANLNNHVVPASPNHSNATVSASASASNSLISNNSTNNQQKLPTIVNVFSAGLPVSDMVGATKDNPSGDVSLPLDITLPSSLSISVVPETSANNSANATTSQDKNELSLYLTKIQERFFNKYKQHINTILTHKEETISSDYVNQINLLHSKKVAKRSKPSLDFCCYILRNVADLGFGQYLVVNGNQSEAVFKKKPFANLKKKQLLLLLVLGIDENEYQKAFKQGETSRKELENVVVIDD